MRLNRSALICLCTTAALCGTGVASAQDATTPEIAPPQAIAIAADPPVAVVEHPDSSELGSAVDLESLGDLRGGTDVDNDIWVNGRVEDAVADDVMTGHNSVTAGSFANASGISTVIQNTGANVLIQNAMIVNVKFADTGP